MFKAESKGGLPTPLGGNQEQHLQSMIFCQSGTLTSIREEASHAWQLGLLGKLCLLRLEEAVPAWMENINLNLDDLEIQSLLCIICNFR